VLADEPLTAVTSSAGAIRGVVTAARSIGTGIVVDAAGAWVRQVGELAGTWVAAAPGGPSPDPGSGAGVRYRRAGVAALRAPR
jgi:glycine/D-amino acid oxidase-like deaminating enzyme